jgi:hypothetical protein
VYDARELWLFSPDSQRAPTAQFRSALGRACRQRGWGFEERTTRALTTLAGQVQTVEPPEVHELYRRIHRANVGVATIDDASVAVDPRTPEKSERLSLSNFVRYKAFFVGRFDLSRATDYQGRLGPREIDQLDAFGGWRGLVDRQGQDDPRHLPLHVFTPGEVWDQLDTAGGRDRFRRLFGPPNIRTDRRRLTWTRAIVRHTNEPQQVGGEQLPVGFHWDVSLSRGGTIHVLSHSEVWWVRRRGYLNVHPNAYIRGGLQSGRAWPPE